MLANSFRRFFINESYMMLAITLNGLVIFALYFPALKHNQWLESIDHFFVLLFLVEAVVKLQVMKPRAYFKDPWNVFDFLIVLGSLPGLLTYFVTFPNTSLLLILRLFRLVRLMRFFRFIPHLQMIIQGLGRAMRASVFVLVALLFLNLMLALFTCHFYGKLAPEYFGNPLISSYTIFQLFTVEGWNEIPAMIAEKTNNPLVVGVSRFYFVLVVLFGGVFGMSLANAIFVDEMTMDNNQNLENELERLHQKVDRLQGFLPMDTGAANHSPPSNEQAPQNPLANQLAMLQALLDQEGKAEDKLRRLRQELDQMHQRFQEP